MFNDPRDRSRDPGFYKDLDDVGKEQLGVPQGEETEDTEALRRIDSNLRSVARHGIVPKARDPLLGRLPQTSPAGEALGGALDAGGNLLRGAAAHGFEMSPARLIERGVNTMAQAGSNLAELGDWAVSPRKPAAFTPKAVKESAENTNTSASAVPGSPPTASQAADAAAKLTGVDSAHVPPQSVNSLATTREIESYYDRPQRGSLRISTHGEPLHEYNPETEDAGEPGQGGYIPSAPLDESPESLARVPVENRPDSYFAGLATRRAIDRGSPAEGELAGTGLTRGEAGQYYGQEYVNRGQNQRAMSLEDFRQRGVASQEERRRREFMAAMDTIHSDYTAKLEEIDTSPAWAHVPEEDKINPDGTKTPGKNTFREKLRNDAERRMQNAQVGSNLGARIGSSEAYKPISLE